MAKQIVGSTVKKCAAVGKKKTRKLCKGKKHVCRWGRGVSKTIGGRKAGGLFAKCR